MDNQSLALNNVFQALADPTRRAVVQQLGRGSAKVSDLAKPFDMALPSFMKHISVLEEAGVITTLKEGRIRSCTLAPQKLAAAEKWFAEQRDLWASRFDNLDSLLNTLKGDKT